jgi:hypothetical protein
MRDYPRINCPNAFQTYNGKGVLFRSKLWGRIAQWKGEFFVAPNSMWVCIKVVVARSDTSFTEETLPLTQEIVESIQPAPQEVLDAFEGEIAFLIPKVLVAPPA